MNERIPILIAGLLSAAAALPGVFALGAFYTPSFTGGRIVLLPRELFSEDHASAAQSRTPSRAHSHTISPNPSPAPSPRVIETTSIARIVPLAPAQAAPSDRITCIRVEGHVYCFTTRNAAPSLPTPSKG